MRNTIAAVVVTSITFFSLGCATIVASGPDRVPVNTNPSGATVYLDNVPVGVTPTTVTMNRSGGGQIRLEMDGYQPVYLEQGKVFNGWFLGNILFGGIIGIVVDVATSNVTKRSEDPVMVVLQAVDENGRKSDPIVLHMVPNT